MNYQAKLSVPFGILGIRCEGAALYGIDFLPESEAPLPPTDAFAALVYKAAPSQRMPSMPNGTESFA